MVSPRAKLPLAILRPRATSAPKPPLRRPIRCTTTFCQTRPCASISLAATPAAGGDQLRGDRVVPPAYGLANTSVEGNLKRRIACDQGSNPFVTDGIGCRGVVDQGGPDTISWWRPSNCAKRRAPATLLHNEDRAVVKGINWLNLIPTTDILRKRLTCQRNPYKNRKLQNLMR
jgi:hypothetical protein